MEITALRAILAVTVPIVGGPFCYLVEHRFGARARTAYALTLGFITAGLTLSLIPAIDQGTQANLLWLPDLGINIGISLDSFSVFVAAVAGCIGSLVIVYSTRYMNTAEGKYSLSRYYWQTLLFIGGMIGLVLTSNLLVMYVCWEVIGFCSYALISYYYRDAEPIRAGTKAFIVTRIGDVGLLSGILILWHATGSLDVFHIMNAASAGEIPTVLLGLAGAGFIAGAIAKSAQFPLHVWLPDAMTAPTTSTALIHAACLVNAGVYLVARSYPIFVGLEWWPQVILWVGAATALLAATIALTQWDIKRVLAYSTISQLGYMMAAIGAGALVAGQFHLVSHAIFKALLFLSAGSIIHAVGTNDLRQMGGLAKKMKVTHFSTIFGLLALVGIPVWTGFFSKDLIMANLLEKGATGPLVLLIVAAFFTAAYSWRLYWLTFRGERRSEVKVHEAPSQMAAPLVILAVGSLLSWLFISPYTSSMVSSLPQYPIDHISLSELVRHAFTSPVIGVTIGVIVTLLLLNRRWRATVTDTFRTPTPATLPLHKAYWFDIAYTKGVGRLLNFWQGFRRVQTGDLNYNNLGIVIGFIVFIVILFAWGI